MSLESFKKFIKAVATGPKGNRDLTLQETEEAMDMILEERIPVTQAAAFLIGWRLKPETNEEFRGGLNSIIKKSKKEDIKESLELGFPFDGKNDSPYIYPLIAEYLNKFDANLIITGDHKIPAKNGVTTKELESALNLSNKKYRYFDRKDYCESLSRLHSLRNDLGLRTALNTLEKYSGVGSSKFCATGVFHKPYVEKYIEIFKERLDGFLLVAGNEGSPELFKKSKCWFMKSGVVEEKIIDPMEFGIKINIKERYEINDSVQALIEPDLELKKLAALNASMYLYLMNKVNSIEEGFKILSSR